MRKHLNIDKRRRKLYLKLLKTRTELKQQVKSKSLETLDQYKVQIKLRKLPRNSTKTRIRNRCILTGRSRGIIGLFKISRIKVREILDKGLLPGVQKSYW